MMNNSVVVNIHNASLTSDSDMHGTALDLGPYVNAFNKKQIIGIWSYGITQSATDGTYDVTWQESSVGGTVTSDWADISGASFTQVVHDGSAYPVSTQTVKFLCSKRYLNSLITMGGTTALVRHHTAVVLQPRFDT